MPSSGRAGSRPSAQSNRYRHLSRAHPTTLGRSPRRIVGKLLPAGQCRLQDLQQSPGLGEGSVLALLLGPGVQRLAVPNRDMGHNGAVVREGPDLVLAAWALLNDQLGIRHHDATLAHVPAKRTLKLAPFRALHQPRTILGEVTLKANATRARPAFSAWTRPVWFKQRWHVRRAEPAADRSEPVAETDGQLRGPQLRLKGAAAFQIGIDTGVAKPRLGEERPLLVELVLKTGQNLR